MKKMFSYFMALVMVMSLALPCAAEEMTADDWSGYNVSPVAPAEQVVPFGTEAPAGPGYNLHANAIYSFGGNASWSQLWLNKNLFGCLKYHVYVNNNSNSTLRFTVRGCSGGDRDFYLPAYTDTATYFSFEDMSFNVDTRDTLFCISFEAPSNFTGTVGCGD